MIRRRVIQFVLLLVLLISGGAIVNVAVAWGCVWAYPRWFEDAWSLSIASATRSAEPGQFISDRKVYRISQVQTSTGHVDVSMSIQAACYAVVVHQTSTTFDRRLQSGWPALALEVPILEQHLQVEPMRGPTPWPNRPLWPGFAINTIFYAAILWVVFCAPGIVKRTLRRRRGLCPACAYPVGTSPVCTECGATIVRELKGV